MDNRERLAKKIVKGLYENRMILTWYRDKPHGWTLANGTYSPLYINLRLICSADPSLYRLAYKTMGLLLKEAGFEPDGKHRLVGVAMAGIPFANAATLASNIPSLYTRKLPADVKTPEELEEYLKKHGHHSLIEGELRSGDVVGIVDDLIATFASKLLAKSQIEEEARIRNLKDVSVKDVFVLLDREQGGAENAAKNGMRLHSLIPFASKGLEWLKGSLSEVEYSTVKDYLADPKKYQSKEIQDRLAELAHKKQ